MKSKIHEHKSSSIITVSKKLVMAMLIAAAIATSVNAQLLVPGNNAGMQPPPPGRERGMREQPRPDRQLQQVNKFQGKVVKMNANDDYVYDGFCIINNGDSLLVKFPLHLGAQVTSAIKTGSTVSVSGVLHISPMGEKGVRMISLTSGNNTITDTAAPTVTPPVETYTTGNGKITQLQTNREGIVNGLIVDNKTILRVPPHIAIQLSSIAQKDVGIAYTGMKKASKQGEVSTADYTIVHCKTITINGQQFLLQ